MIKLRELFILFLILIGCLIINFTNKNPLVINDNLEKTTQTQPNKIENLFTEETQLIKQENIKPAISMTPNENTDSQEVFVINKVLNALEIENENSVPDTKTLSLETVLTEIKKISAELELEFEIEKYQKENCSTCDQTEELSINSTCATIWAVVSGGGSCNCASLNCTPPEGPWCVHPCCCVCCAACCR